MAILYPASPIKRLTFLLMGIILPQLAAAQKKAASALDVDRLYALYHNKKEVTFRAGNRDITANVLVYYNAYHQPYAIILYGEAEGLANIDQVKQQLSTTKINEAYIKDNGRFNAVNFDLLGAYENNVEVTVYRKGSQYAKYGIKKMQDRNPIDTLNNDNTPSYISDFFYFEVGDMARKQAAQTGKLVF